MSFDFLKKIIPEKPILSKEDMDIYKKYMKDIGYFNPMLHNNPNGNKKPKRFNRTSRKNRA